MLYIFTGECIPQLQSESPKIPAQRAFYFYLNTPLKRFHIASNMQVVPHMHRENAIEHNIYLRPANDVCKQLRKRQKLFNSLSRNPNTTQSNLHSRQREESCCLH